MRGDLGSFLGDGFLEGQWVEVCVSDGAGNCTGATGRFKIAVIRGDNEGNDEKLEFRSYTDLLGGFHLVDDLGAAGFGAPATVLIRRIAAVATFTDTNWYLEQEVDLLADIGYVVPISRDGVKVFPVQTHGLWKLQGPLAVEGGVTGADRSLQLGVKLPGEVDGPLFAIGTQPPESKQIDVLNIFNDGSKADEEGVLTSISLTGFGLPKDLDFGPSYSSGNPQTFGEPAIFPGGISFGTVEFVDGVFQTDNAKSSIEVVNFLGGVGNDRLDVQGTLDPDDAVKTTGSVIVTAVPGGVDVTRSQPFDWKAQGFLVGQPVTISGIAGSWVVSGFSDSFDGDTVDNTVMHLAGPSVSGQVVHTIIGSFEVDGYAFGGLLTHPGIGPLFAVGDQVAGSIDFVTGVWQVLAVTFNTVLLGNGPALADSVNASANLTKTTPVLRTLIAGDVPVQANVPITIAGGEEGGYVTRTDGGSWADDGFLEGQLVRIQGLDGSWRVRRIQGSNGETLRLERGAVLPTISAPSTRLVYWPGPHGGLTVVHGGGNTAIRIEFDMDSTGTTVTRLDGLSWIDAGFSIGQRVQVEGDGKTRTIVDFANADCPFTDPFPGCGLDSTMVLSNDAFGDPVNAASGLSRAVHVAEPEQLSTTASMNVTVQAAGPLGLPTSTLTCGGNCFAVTAPNGTHFEAGMRVTISGLAGPWTIVSVTPTAMVLQGAALTPTYKIVNDVVVFTPLTLTVATSDVRYDGGTRMGGDTTIVCNTRDLVAADKACRGALGTDALAGPNSPLVVYGDTSQDGVWYGGHGWDIKGYEFGPKPFDPFYRIPDDENEDDEWVFPVADPFDYAGNDVIDASGLFAWSPAGSLPSVGFTAYGGAGNDLIIGSQTGDHLAGGSGEDTILGLRGVDHIYGDSGFNVDILTRGLTVTAVNSSPAPTLDERNPAGDQTIKPGPSANADAMVAGRDLLYGESPETATAELIPALTYRLGRELRTITTLGGGPQEAYDDIIFGDHGFVGQQTADTNEPDPRLQKIQTTTIASVRLIESRAYQNGGDDAIFGNLGRDVVIAGAGHDLADGDEADDMLFGDNAFLGRRVVEAQFPTATDYAGPPNSTSGRFQALCGTILYSRTDRPTDTCGAGVDADTSGKLLVNGVWKPYRDPDSPGIDQHPWWAEYAVDFDDDNLANQFHSFDVQLSVDAPANPAAKGAGSFGNDYLAGSQGHDQLFGQMGNDVIQGDGGIEKAFAAERHVGASRSPDGCTVPPGGGLICDYVGDLDIVPSFEATTDGEDYIEGGGGSDIVFGGLGQDDITGGSSDFFGLADETLSLVGQTVTISGLAGTYEITVVSGGTLTLSGLSLPNLAASKTVEIVGANRKLTSPVTLTSSATGGTLSIAGFNWAALGLLPGKDRRPDGRDLLFGGAGTQIGRSQDDAFTDGTTTAQEHARDADTIVDDNGRIVRIVGTNGVDLLPAARYVTFTYDNYGAMKIVVRGVHQLDYTPGGPDFLPAAFFAPGTENPLCSNTGADATGECSTPLASVAGTGDCHGNIATATDPADLTPSRYTDIGGADEVHGESSDDTVYSGCGGDVIYGDAQDDDLIGGWGNDWISGGTGVDGVLGDDGRIFTSRNSANGVTTGGTACTGTFQTLSPGNYLPTETCFSEPLYGVAALVPLAQDPDTKTSQGFVLNEFAYTPGLVQQATINVAGVIKKQVDITPYNLGPNDVVGHFQVDVPTYDANNSDDVIFGGFDDDFLHGASGDDAMSGAEAMPESYVQHFNTTTCNQANPVCENGLIRDDWTRPWNPGNLLLFGADDNPWNSPKPFTSRLGEFYLYDEFDPRRPLLFNGSGLTWGCTAFSNSGHTCVSEPLISGFPYQYFLNLVETTKVVSPTTTIPITEGRETAVGCIQVAQNGTCLLSATVVSDGNDVLFGDLGNDWSVGGSGKDEIYAGWGNDLSNADDILTTNGSHNDTTDQHPTYEDRVYGGAGVDILIGNTFGDRLIDWVGEWDTYLVPFSPFGINTVSRQVEPQLPEFLYAISFSNGADPTRDSDQVPPTTNALRNGEPFGEIGLVIQKDQGIWQQQTGGPTDPQAGGLPGGGGGGGGGKKTLSAANFDNGAMQGFAIDSGVWETSGGTLGVGAASLGKDAAAVFYVDAYKPTYFELLASVQVTKPTAGWNANAFLLFDYFSPTDFKFAGIDISLNKVVLGHRTATGWIYDAQAPFQGALFDSVTYDVTLIVNGFVVTVAVNGIPTLTQRLAPRWVDGVPNGFNTGLVGLGSNNSRGIFDNVAVQILPPASTFANTEDYQDGAADLFTGAKTGGWAVSSGRYVGTGGLSVLGPGVDPAADAYVEWETVLRGGVGGLAFDVYSSDDYKYVTIDQASGAVVVGHLFKGRFMTDLTIARTITGADQKLTLALLGTGVTVSLNGTQLATFAFNANVVDGALGLLAKSGSVSFDNTRTQVGTQVINALDNTPPTLTAPADVTRSTDAGTATALVADATLGTATATDDVAVKSLVRTGVPAGNVFAIGVTTITWTAVDYFGHQVVKTQKVTILDTEKPKLTVPANVSRTISSSQSSIVITDAELGAAAASDNSGSVTVTRTGVPAGNVFPVGTTTITYTATDAFGNTTTGTQTVIVIRPGLVVTPGPGQGANEGSTVTYSLGSFSGGSGGWVVTVDWGDGTAASTFSASPGALAAAHAYVNDRGLPYTVRVTVTDSSGASASATFAVAVANVAPTLTITSPAAGSIFGSGKAVTLSGSFADAGKADTHTCTIDWGDGKSETGAVTESQGSGKCAGSHTYRQTGTYTIRVTVTDSGGATITKTVSISVTKSGTATISLYSAGKLAVKPHGRPAKHRPHGPARSGVRAL